MGGIGHRAYEWMHADRVGKYTPGGSEGEGRWEAVPLKAVGKMSIGSGRGKSPRGYNTLPLSLAASSP